MRNFRLIPITHEDVRLETEDFSNLQDLVISNENMYPNIAKWFRDKVLIGLQSGERVGYVGYVQNKPCISAIIKHGVSAKFCHLKIDHSLYLNNIGELIFFLMIFEVFGRSERIHFTLPESLWEEKKEFFKSFGFSLNGKYPRCYRSSQEELLCSADITKVWTMATHKLPKLQALFSYKKDDSFPKLLLSMSPNFAFKVLEGKKTVELRRRFSKRWKRSRIAIYATSPIQAIIGEATVEEVFEGPPEIIWTKYLNQIRCSKKEFDVYASGCSDLFAIQLTDVVSYPQPTKRERLSNFSGKRLVPPRSYLNVSKNNAWRQSITIEKLLHFTCRSSTLK